MIQKKNKTAVVSIGVRCYPEFKDEIEKVMRDALEDFYRKKPEAYNYALKK